MPFFFSRPDNEKSHWIIHEVRKTYPNIMRHGHHCHQKTSIISPEILGINILGKEALN